MHQICGELLGYADGLIGERQPLTADYHSSLLLLLLVEIIVRRLTPYKALGNYISTDDAAQSLQILVMPKSLTCPACPRDGESGIHAPQNDGDMPLKKEEDA
ncbi:hypothetical protein Ddc_05134 [Ditylenchus destructor]|nr:hypothetical protein Ddc_05134 [Ditylenchus destructor]